MDFSGSDSHHSNMLNQLDEDERKLWLSRHVTQGKAYEAVSMGFKWLVARHQEGNVIQRDPWFEPFAADRPGLISRMCALTMMLRTLEYQAEEKVFPEIKADGIKHELRGELLILLRELDQLYDAHAYLFGESKRRQELRSEELARIKKDVEEALGEDLHRKANGSADEIVQIFERRYRDSYQKALDRSIYPGSPYLLGEVLLQINYTDTAGVLMRLLVHAVRWNCFSASGDSELVDRIGKCLVRTFRWLERNARPMPEGRPGIGWGWAGQIVLDEEGSREEIATVTMLDAELCLPQVYFTSRVVSSLAKLHRLLQEEKLPFVVKLDDLELGQVEKLLVEAKLGLMNSYQREHGDVLGWVDFEPYDPTMPDGKGPNKIKPAGYDSTMPGFLDTAYAVISLAETVSATKGHVALDEAEKQTLLKGAGFLFAELRREPTLTWLSGHTFSHVLSRQADGSLLRVMDECALYSIFKALALFSELRDEYNYFPSLTMEEKKAQNIVYYRLADFIMTDVRNAMTDNRGFPALGLQDRDFFRFPAIRATKNAVDAFLCFGIHQQVPSVERILEKHLSQLKETFILELVQRYGELESQGIRVAWGLIENDGKAIRDRHDKGS
jgi:hypothetical protein